MSRENETQSDSSANEPSDEGATGTDTGTPSGTDDKDPSMSSQSGSNQDESVSEDSSSDNQPQLDESDIGTDVTDEMIETIEEFDTDAADAFRDLVSAHQELERKADELRDRVQELDEENENLEHQVEELEQRLQKQKQEFQNYKERKQTEVEEIKESAGAETIEEFLSIRDDLKRALDQGPDGDIYGGVKITARQFDNTLEELGVSIVDPEPGEQVDPEVHEVVTSTKSDTVEEGNIVDCYERGYTFSNQVLRSARIIVSDG